MIVRWPGVIKPGTIVNEIFWQEDWMPTLLAAAGEPDIVAKLKTGYQANGKTFKVHADGYNFMPYLEGEAKKGPREEILYFGQGGELNAIRWNDWKVHFATQNGNIATALREVPGWPVIVTLRAAPYERAPGESGMYIRWYGTISGSSCPCSRSSLVGATAERLDVIDFKTDAPPRESAARSYPEHVAQVRAYGALLAASGAARDRAMRTGLLFSADGSIRWV